MRSTKLPSWIERLLGLDPTPAPPHVFAITPGRELAGAREAPSVLRYGSFRDAETGYVFEHSEARELPADIWSDGVVGGPVRDPDALKMAVAELVGSLPGPIEKASLVLPDTWLRLIFLELSELPRKRAEREDILRWKLKRLVPFRVEDLRIDAIAVAPLPNQDEPRRLMLSFGVEKLLAQLEDAFDAAGVELGRITNATLATLANLEHAVEPDQMAALVMVQEDAYTLTYFKGDQPLVYRYKAFGDTAGPTAGSVRRVLRMTSGFVTQTFPAEPLRRVFLTAHPEEEDSWLSWLYDELEAAPEPLSFEHFRIARTQVGPSWLETAPLLGAASQAIELIRKTVNLARRPFVIRRPIVRFAALLWLIGAILLALNVHLYRSYWQGSAENRSRLAQAERQLEERLQTLERQNQALDQVDLGSQNRRTAFLNSLIAYRTFPWSALFDDLQEVLPDDVRLFTVQPAVRLAEDLERARRQQRASDEASERPRRRGAARGRDAAGAESAPPAETEQGLARDEVALRLTGFANTEEALFEFVDRLYADPSFRAPNLGGETGDGAQPGRRTSTFTINVVYLTPSRLPPEPPAAQLAGAAEAGGEDVDLAAGDVGAEDAGSPEAAGAAAGRAGAAEAAAASGGRLGSSSAGAPVGSSRTGSQATGSGARLGTGSRTDPDSAGRRAGARPAGTPPAGTLISTGLASGQTANEGSDESAPADGEVPPPATDRQSGDPSADPRDPNDPDAPKDDDPFEESDASASPTIDRGARLEGPGSPAGPWASPIVPARLHLDSGATRGGGARS